MIYAITNRKLISGGEEVYFKQIEKLPLHPSMLKKNLINYPGSLAPGQSFQIAINVYFMIFC